MISCTDFIPSYSALFFYIDSRQGKQGVIDYWKHISDTYVKERLGEEASEKGIRGCWDYWSKALNEEAADFTMTLDEEAGVYESEMRYCPSKGRLLEMKHVTPYPHYCDHCDILYRRVLEPLGFTYEYDMSRVDKAACGLRITKKKAQ